MSDIITHPTTRQGYAPSPRGHNVLSPSFLMTRGRKMRRERQSLANMTRGLNVVSLSSSSRDDVSLRLYASLHALLVIVSLSGSRGCWAELIVAIHLLVVITQ